MWENQNFLEETWEGLLSDGNLGIGSILPARVLNDFQKRELFYHQCSLVTDPTVNSVKDMMTSNESKCRKGKTTNQNGKSIERRDQVKLSSVGLSTNRPLKERHVIRAVELEILLNSSPGYILKDRDLQ